MDGLRILVVDDNVVAARGLAQMLSLSDHIVRIVHDGKEAVCQTVAFTPDVVFVDILLPGLNGYDVALAIRRMAQPKRPFLCALTGWAGNDKRVRSRAAGFDEHLTKPIEFATIEQIIAKARG